MRSTHEPTNSHKATNANAPKNARLRGALSRRTVIAAAIAIAVLSIAVVGSNAAGGSFVESVKKFLGVQPTQTSLQTANPYVLKNAQIKKPLSPSAVTTVFSDDFSTNTTATYTTTGAIGASAWSVTRSGADWGARRNTSPAQLELTNDVGGTANVNGFVLASTPSSSFLSPYSTTLSSNPGLVTWTFNMRTNRPSLAGFGSGSYGEAFILAGTANTNTTTGSGYAIVLGNSGAPDPIRLARYSSGFQGTITNIVTANTAGFTDTATNYYSVKVTYLPSTNTWEVFLKDDGATAFADPTAGTLTSQGTAVDSTNTGTSLPLMGAWWQGSTAANQTAFFDNTTVTVTQPSIVVIGGPLSFANTSVGSNSAEQTYTVSGSNLTANLVVTAPSTDFQVSMTSGSGFGPTVSLTPSSGTVATTTIFVRFTPQSIGLKTGNITNASTGATTQNVAVSGTGVAPCLSTITVNDTGDAPDAAIGDGVCATAGAVCTLRAAIAEANTVGVCAGSVSINITATGTITLGSALPDITRDMVIDGPGAASLTIDGNSATVIGTASHPSPESVTISDVTMTNGRSTNASLAGGFSNNSTGTLNITNVVMSNNAQVAISGGGGALAQTQAGTLNITDSTINNNTAVAAGARGAGVYKGGGNLNVLRSTFNNNSADIGGAVVLASGGVTTFVNSTFSGNTAASANAVLLASGGNSTFTNCTITNNSGAGAVIQRASGTVTFKNSIVAQNGSELSGGSFVSLGYNLIGNNTGEEPTFPAGTPNANNDYVGTGASPLNPRLGPLANNGGPTQTHALLDGSLATDHGSSGLSNDQRGQTRPYDNPFIVAASGGDNSDIGAYEAQTNLAGAETDVAVSGGNLVISDANGGTTADTLTISLNGANVRVNDPNNALTAGSGATEIDPNTVEVPLASISGNIQVNTLGGNDQLTLALAGGDFIPAGGVDFAGGTQTSVPGDKLVITGGSQGTVTYNYTNPNDGDVVMSAFGTVTYTGLEPITNSGTAADVVFNLPSGGNPAVTLSDDGTPSNGMSRLSSPTFEMTDFANPTGSVTVNPGDATDAITVNALPDFNANLTIGSNANPFATIDMAGTVTVTGSRGISLAGGDVGGAGNISTGGGLFVDISGFAGTLSGVIGGAGGITKQGLGILTLSGSNTYTGATAIPDGVLSVGTIADGGLASNIGASSSLAQNLVINGGALEYTGAGASTNRLFTALGGELENNGTGPLNFTNTGSINTGTLATTFTFCGNYSGPGSNTFAPSIPDPFSDTWGLVMAGTTTWDLNGTNTYTGVTSIVLGRLNINGSITSNVLVPGGTLGGTGTVNSANSVTTSGGTIAPGTSPGILNTGNVTLDPTATFDVEIGGTTPGNAATDHDQLNVTGTIDLDDATLNLSAFNGFAPLPGNTFVIINNDLVDSITGIFDSLSEGATITNFLGSSYDATITYTGGTDSNDVVLTVVSPCTPPAIVYVDDSWVGTTPGTDPDMGGPATNFGCDSFATIQDGVNGVATSGTVNVAAGSYVENVTIPQALTLTGAGAASVFVYPAISDPNCGGAGGGSLCAGSSNLMLVQASNVTISGLTLDGDNTTLTSGEVFGGADIDARNGIITNHLAGLFNNLEVHHTTVKNIYLRGMYASSGGTFNFHDNTVQNVQASFASIGMFNFGGAGAFTNNNVSLCNDAIASNNSRGTTYTGNTVTSSASGIHSDNNGSGGGSADTISNNTVTNSTTFGYGIWTFVPYLPITVSNNTVTNVDVGLAAAGGTTPVATTFTGNTVDAQNKAASTGVYLTTSQFGFGEGNNLVEFRSNTVVNAVDGFYLEANTFPIANRPTVPGRELPVAVNVSEPLGIAGVPPAMREAAPDAVFTLTVNAHFNRVVNNTGTQATSTGSGTVVGDFENNWWGCNAGPNNLGCGSIVGPGVDFNPWIVLQISASPATIPPGGSSTITADMTHNSVNAVPSVTEFVPQVAVTFGATNGTVFPTSGTIVNGQATTTFTSNSTSSGTASATVDNQTVQTPVNVSAANTYTWSPLLGSTNYTLPTNWTPTRFLPQVNDNLVVNGTTTSAPLITDVPTQTIAGLHLINGPQVTLQAGGANTLTINGATGSDLTVPAGSFLTLDGSNGLTIKVSGSGSAGTFGGVFIELSGAHKLFGDSGGVITFQNSSLATTGTGVTSNPFGTGVAGDGDTGSVVFASGSIYSHNGGLSPFGTVGNGPVATFQLGSLARWFTNSGFQASDRTYANLQIGDGTNVVNVFDSGTGDFSFDNLEIKSTPSADSSLTYNGSGTAAINIRGNVLSTGNGTGGTLPDLTLTPGSGGTHINKNGGGTLIFSSTANTRAIDLEGGATVENGTTLSLARVVLLGLANPHLNTLTVNSTAGLTGGSSTSYVVGGVEKISMPANFIFPVGTTGAYSPVDLANATTGDLRVAARTPQQPVLAAGTSLQRYWTLTEGDALTADLTFHYLDGDVAGNENNYRVVVVEAGNATSFPADANHNVNTAANTFTKLGVQTFSDWTAAEPAAPTAVKLSSFNATRFSNGAVELNWQSGYEVRNLGYNVYREQNGKRVALTPSLVAGSALMAGRQTQFTAGLSYSWIDDLGVKGKGARGSDPQSAISNPKSPVTYWLEDVDVDGTRMLHGPIAVSDCSGADCKKLNERSRLLSEVTNPQSAISNPQSGVELNSYPAAVTAPDPSDPEPDPMEMQRTIAGLPALKLSVSRPGWYRLTQPEVLAAGLNIADANGLQLYRDGRQVAFRLSNTTEQFGPTDYLEFYGDGLSSATASAQTYYLVKLPDAGKRIEVKPLQVSPGDRVSPQGFAYTVERKERMIYFSGLLNGDAENFFGQVVSSSAVNATIPIEHLDATAQSAGTPAQLEVVLQGVTGENHAVQVRINGTELGTLNFANTEHPSQTLSVPATAIHDGNNTIELTALGGATDVSLVDVLRLTYVRSYVADNNALTFNLSSRQTKKVTGFTSDQIRVVDVSDPYNVLELTPHIAPDGSGFTAMIGVDVEVRAPFSRPHELLAFAIGDAAPVDAIRLNEASSWSAETAGADYLIITTGDLAASVQPLAQLRQAGGLEVKVIDVEDLYDEFSFGAHSPQAIRDLLAKATADWTRKPHYVVFAGDASFDPKNYLGQGLNDLVPTKLIDTTLAETASDDWLADFNNDGITDLALGRLPVRTSGELAALVNKIVSYENAVPDPSRGALLVSDTGFEAPNGVVQGLLPSGMTVSTINRSAADDTTVHNQIIAGLNQGPLVANYIGHGSNGVWTGASLLSNADAPLLTNTNRLSVFTMMTCYNGFFQNAFNDSLSETLLKAPGGAVAVWASTTLTDPTGQNAIDQEFYRLLFGAQPATVGDAARAAKFVTGDPNVRRTWTLFGDPALRLR